MTSDQVARALQSGWRREGLPGYIALASGIRAMVLSGRVPLRTRLPSERELAHALSVSRTTTGAAYDLLRTEGYLESRPGSGTRVALPLAETTDRETAAASSVNGPGSIDLTMAALAAPSHLTEALALATQRLPGLMGTPGLDPAGLPGLRKAVAAEYARRGLPTTPEQLLITSGAQSALTLLVSVLLAPGDQVVVESPTYHNALAALARARTEVVPWRLGRETWDMDVLAAITRRRPPRLIYTISEFHNPTGLLMPGPDRAELVRIAARSGAHLITDEVLTDIDLDGGPRPRPLGAYSDDEQMISVGSMSKAYWGGLRVGWIRASVPLVRRLVRERVSVDLATPPLEQLISENLLEHRGDVLAERIPMLKARRDALVTGLREQLDQCHWTVPRGGLALWVRLPDADAESIARLAAHEGVALTPGPLFSSEPWADSFIRIPFTVDENRLARSLEVLGAVIRRDGATAAGRRTAGTRGRIHRRTRIA
ncbi:MAG: MocR-like transcription factor YczR [Candidatus Dormibacteria bacterium]